MHFAHTGTSRKLAIIEALLIHSHPANVLLLETMLTAHMLAARQQQPCSSSRAWPLYFRSLLAPLGVPGDVFLRYVFMRDVVRSQRHHTLEL